MVLLSLKTSEGDRIVCFCFHVSKVSIKFALVFCPIEEDKYYYCLKPATGGQKRNHGTIGPFKLEKTHKILKSKHHATKSTTKPCP